ncbi:MAG: serine/threonine-protein kinase, partial [archaeon]|nr:serine/threonine-protein kinase [archaeon]
VVCLFDPKRASSSISMKYYTVMSGKDLIFFNANAKTELKFVMTLNKAFITKGNKQVINATTYYPANIDFSSKYSFILLFDKEFNRDEWVENISTEIGYREIEDYYEIGKNVIGKGGFGEVRTCNSKQTREEYAVKMLDKDKLQRGESELILSEISIMQLIVHKNIVRLHDTFEDKKFLYVVMDYLQGGDLIELINKRLGNISEQEAAKIIKQIANGINYMHKLGLVHRDLKSENCVFSKKDDYSGLKLIDFGLTRTLARGETLTETLGTLGYAAPEIICRKPYDHKIDVFSIGIISFSILTGHLPFDEKDEKLLIKKLLYSQIDFTTEEFQKRSKGCHKFLDRCLEKNPEIRYSIDDVLNDDWLNVNSA